MRSRRKGQLKRLADALAGRVDVETVFVLDRNMTVRGDMGDLGWR
jgi:hypothetical protein